MEDNGGEPGAVGGSRVLESSDPEGIGGGTGKEADSHESGGAGSAGEHSEDPATSGGASGAESGGKGREGACSPGTFSCLGDLLRLCSDQGQFLPKEACGTGLCSAEQGKCLDCAPGSVKGCASEHARSVCKEDGSGYTLAPCSDELPFCDQGVCVACLEASTCPQPKEACLQPVCLSGKCGVQPRPKGYTPEDKTAEDCLRGVCDGKGGEELVFDKTDPPKSNSACFSYICEEGGSFTIVHAPAGTSCGEGCFCNGKGNYGKCIPGTSTCEDSVLRQCKDGVVVETLCKEELPSCSEGACRGVLQLAAGGDHSCAMLTNQRVHCWGRNHVGQLGIGTNHPTQTQYGAVVGLTGVLSVAAGDHHTCAIVEGGKVFCWGDNEFGQVGAGPGAPEYYTVPIEVKGLSGVTQLGLGHGFSCALTVTGQVHCWGKNDRSQMDAGWSTPNVLSPKQISIESADQLAVGRAHACVLTKIGSVVCWGSCESWQTVGSPSSPCGWSTQKPLPVEGLLPDVVQIQAGGDHTCALSAEGVQCWGRNDRGQLGVKKSSEKEPPTLTSFPKPGKVAALALGMNHTCLLSDGTVSCVGWNNLGQLGRGYLPTPGVHPEFEATPGLVVDTDHALLHGITQISARTDFTLARKNDGNLFGWGNGQYGKSIGPWFLPDPVAYQFAVHIWYVN